MDALGALANECHFSGTHTRMFLVYLKEHLGQEILNAVLDRAGETRPIQALVDDTQWSTYGQFRRLLEAASTVLGGSQLLAEFGAVASFSDSGNAEYLDMFQAFGSPGALYAKMRESVAFMTPILDAAAEEIGPNEWVISERFRDGFEPFAAHCSYNAGLLSITTRLFGLPAADVVEEACQRAGAPACRFRIRWDPIDEATRRSEFLESRVAMFQARLEALQLTVTDLVSGDNLHDVLTRIVESAAAAVRAPVYVLAVGDAGSVPERVYAKGVDGEDAARIAHALLTGDHGENGYMVVDVASTRRNYGRLAAIDPGGDRFFSTERGTLDAYGRLAAAALDSATALEEARRQATTARTLLALSVSLGAVTSAEEAAAELVRAVPVIVDCDRAMVVLFDPHSSKGHVAASVGFPDDVSAAFDALLLGTPVQSPSETVSVDYFDMRSGFHSPLVREMMERMGVVGMASVAIVSDNEPMGWVVAAVIDRPERLGARQELVERLGGLAAQAAATISKTRLVERIRHQALHDTLTRLPNRALIMDRVEQMLARGRRHHLPVAALFIDLDGFKDVNDSLGHAVGDQLLQTVGGRLQSAVRDSDTVGRLGGDEFVVLVEGISDDALPELVAQRLLKILGQPLALGDGDLPVTITASIGIATGDRPTPGDLLRDADIALYEAKRAGKNRHAVFTAQMQNVVYKRMQLEGDLRAAVNTQQFFLVYQPIFNMSDGLITGAEALLRWRHPCRGIIQPDDFIPTLEDTGMIVEVGGWVVREACDQAAAWRRQGFNLDISVNVSARQLETDGLVDDVNSALATSGLNPTSLTLEITETTLMRDPKATARRLHAVKAAGVRVAIDDFGTGYSSLAYLNQFPVDVIKIDRSFVSALTDSADSEALLRSLVHLGRSLGLHTVAEGIENENQYDRLRHEQCDSGQGFLIARPLEVAQFEAFMHDRPPSPRLRPPAKAALSGSVH